MGRGLGKSSDDSWRLFLNENHLVGRGCPRVRLNHTGTAVFRNSVFLSLCCCETTRDEPVRLKSMAFELWNVADIAPWNRGGILNFLLFQLRPRLFSTRLTLIIGSKEVRKGCFFFPSPTRLVPWRWLATTASLILFSPPVFIISFDQTLQGGGGIDRNGAEVKQKRANLDFRRRRSFAFCRCRRSVGWFKMTVGRKWTLKKKKKLERRRERHASNCKKNY